jgi:hypothetical protein
LSYALKYPLVENNTIVRSYSPEPGQDGSLARENDKVVARGIVDGIAIDSNSVTTAVSALSSRITDLLHVSLLVTVLTIFFGSYA